MEKIQLNLARKWRSQNFDRIVGQDLAVRILKNSLFLGKFFPVYLLAGQHGCGKTTAARVFAAAINCAALPDFQLDPQKNLVPCGTCQSCLAIRAGKHPDFIEIDAASHTGVDNVRQLLETATLMPQMGRKKIYLIDEAHMLSKAAFNAFLKMLEEPNDFVLFILATTDEHKIIETVKSRCFQLFFQAVAPEVLRDYLRFVCEQESIACDILGLDLIVAQSRGSVRDALNLLEQVFLSEKQIGKEQVLRVCGAAADEVIIKIFKALLHAATPLELMSCLQEVSFEHYNGEYLWRQLLELLHASLWLGYGVQAPAYAFMHDLSDDIRAVSVDQLMSVFNLWCQQEVVFLRTVNKPIFIQFFLLRAWHVLHTTSHVNNVESHEPVRVIKKDPVSVAYKKELPVQPAPKQRCLENTNQVPTEQNAEQNNNWCVFVRALEQLEQPLLVSIFKQARVVDVKTSAVRVQFTQRLVFLNDTIEQTKACWMPLFVQHFGDACILAYDFVAIQEQSGKVTQKQTNTNISAAQAPCVVKSSMRGAAVDVSDKNKWPLTHELLKEFPGTVTVLHESKKIEQNTAQEVSDELK